MAAGMVAVDAGEVVFTAPVADVAAALTAVRGSGCYRCPAGALASVVDPFTATVRLTFTPAGRHTDGWTVQRPLRAWHRLWAARPVEHRVIWL